MQPMEILQAVRKGFALATPAQLELVRACQGLDLLDGGWVPRWALEAASALESAGCGAEQVRALFSQGQAAVQIELSALVRAGRLGQAVIERRPYQRQRIDLPTEMALTGALQEHRTGCAPCTEGRCSEGRELQEELGRLFPAERRRKHRG